MTADRSPGFGAILAVCSIAVVNCGGQHEDVVETPNTSTAFGGTTGRSSSDRGGAANSKGGKSSSIRPATTNQGGTWGSSSRSSNRGGSWGSSSRTTSSASGGHNTTGGVPATGGTTGVIGVAGGHNAASGGDWNMGGSSGSGGDWNMGGSSGNGGDGNLAGAAGSTGALCRAAGWCCEACEQQARTAFYLDANGQRVSCADPSCTTTWCYLTGRVRPPESTITCMQTGEWPCVDTWHPGEYRAVEPVCP